MGAGGWWIQQADGWGDDWDFFWEEDEDEEWIVLFNEEGDVEEAYHFSPKADWSLAFSCWV